MCGGEGGRTRRVTFLFMIGVSLSSYFTFQSKGCLGSWSKYCHLVTVRPGTPESEVRVGSWSGCGYQGPNTGGVTFPSVGVEVLGPIGEVWVRGRCEVVVRPGTPGS